MNSKITLPELVSLLAEKTGVSKRQCEIFLKTVFSNIGAALAARESVKIKGLGTFKLTEIDSRKSVDVNTGQEIEIAGHYRVSFSAEKTLAELINAPFELFETVELNDGVTDDMLAAADDESSYPADETDWLPKPEEAATETADMARLPEIPVSEELPVETAPMIYNIEDEATDEQDSVTSQADETTAVYGEEETQVRKPFSLTPPSGTYVEDEIPVREEQCEKRQTVASSSVSADSAPEDGGQQTENVDSITDRETAVSDNIAERKRKKSVFGRGFAAGLFTCIIVMAVAGMFWYHHTAAKPIASADTAVAVAEVKVLPDTPVTAEVTAAGKNTDTVAVKTPEAVDKEENTPKEEEKKVKEAPVADTKPSDSPQYDVISNTRFLTTMAKAHYGSYHLWPYIYEANKGLGHPDRIRPGTRIMIPDLAKMGVDPTDPAVIAAAKKKGTAIYNRYNK